MSNYTIPGRVYREGNLDSQFDLASGMGEMSQREAVQLVNSYVASLVIGGATATFDRIGDEYKLVRADGAVEYVWYPRQAGTAAPAAPLKLEGEYFNA